MSLSRSLLFRKDNSMGPSWRAKKRGGTLPRYMTSVERGMSSKQKRVYKKASATIRRRRDKMNGEMA